MPDGIIPAKFSQWTARLDPKEARISVYNHIRDIPYAIVPELRDPVSGPAGMLELGKGSCIPKHFLLGMLFQKLGIPVKYCTYLYSWDDPRIKYPPDLRSIVKELPMGTHLACRAHIEGQWVLVDATWDGRLKKAGFSVNENWDGLHPTKNAIKPMEEVVHDTVEERVRYTTEAKKSWTEAQARAYEKFPAVFNAWLEACRRAG